MIFKKVTTNFRKTCSLSVHIGGLDLSGPGGMFISMVD